MLRATAPHRITATDNEMVAREVELERILSIFDLVGAGAGRIALLAGEPGIGKTRLAREVVARARAQGPRVLGGRCFEEHTAVPFYPFTELFTYAFAGASA